MPVNTEGDLLEVTGILLKLGGKPVNINDDLLVVYGYLEGTKQNTRNHRKQFIRNYGYPVKK